MAISSPYFAISEAEAAKVIDHYESIAQRATQIAEMLRTEVLNAEQKGRPINKVRFVAVCKWFGGRVRAPVESREDHWLGS